MPSAGPCREICDEPQFSSGLKLFYLERIAYKTHARRSRVISRDFALFEARSLLNSNPRTKSLNPVSLLDEVVYRSSLLRPVENAAYEFVHLSFQEFFCAKHLVRVASVKEVERALFADWWKNTNLFYFGLLRSMDHIRLIEKRATGAGHVLMEYLAEADLTSRATRETVLSVVARQIISDPNIPESVLDVYRAQAVDLVPALREVIQRTVSGFIRSEHVGNYFRFLLTLGAAGAPDAIRDADLVLQLQVPQLTGLLQDYPWLVGEGAYVAFVPRVLQAIESKFESEWDLMNDYHRKRAVNAAIEYNDEIARRVRNAVGIEFKTRQQWLHILDSTDRRLQFLKSITD